MNAKSDIGGYESSETFWSICVVAPLHVIGQRPSGSAGQYAVPHWVRPLSVGCATSLLLCTGGPKPGCRVSGGSVLPNVRGCLRGVLASPLAAALHLRYVSCLLESL